MVERLDDGDHDDAFAAVDPVSIDYAVLEDAENAFVVPAALDGTTWGRGMPSSASSTAKTETRCWVRR